MRNLGAQLTDKEYDEINRFTEDFPRIAKATVVREGIKMYMNWVRNGYKHITYPHYDVLTETDYNIKEDEQEENEKS